jgi:uncharacterized protein (TIGR02271 family)
MFNLMYKNYATLLNMQQDVLARAMSFASPLRYREIEIGEADQRVISLAKEELQVGKRQVRRAKTYRIRTTVKEVPVEQAISLRAETVQIERRPTRGQALDGQEFQEQTIEVQEMYEEPVVGKVVLKTEEVVVRKLVTERTAVIHDTVRVTDVEVEGEEGRDTDRGEVVLLEAAGDKPDASRSAHARKRKGRESD